MKDFTQLYSSMIYFKEDMKQRWDLAEYNDPNSPSVFLGLPELADVHAFVNHKSFKLLYFAGADCTPEKIQIVKNTPNVMCIGWSPWVIQILKSNNIPYKAFNLPLKYYDDFKSTMLGENIYVYKGLHGNRADYFMWDSVVKPLEQVFGSDRVIHTSFQPFNVLIDKYYNDCFVYIKPNQRGGSTAMWELGYMGRKTISINQGNLPHVLNSNSLEETIKLIMQESKKIGTFQHQLSKQVHNSFLNSDEWLYLNFYNWKIK